MAHLIEQRKYCSRKTKIGRRLTRCSRMVLNENGSRFRDNPWNDLEKSVSKLNKKSALE